MSGWERQKREIFSYNLFHSGIKWRHNTNGLRNHGFGLVGVFMRISEAKADVYPEPDFTLYDGETLLFVEIKSGNNINESDIRQMSEYSRLDLEDVENFLDNTQLSTYSSDTVESFEHCIIYFEDFIENCRDKWKNCKKQLEKLESETVVLTQQRGEALEISGGSFDDPDLNSIFGAGIDLPPATDKTIYLTENIEHEALSYSICNDLAINNLQDGEFTVTPTKIRSFYGREMSIVKVTKCLDFLNEIGACRMVPDEENKYRFDRADINEIVGVGDYLQEKSVEEYLDERDDEQSGLDDFY